MTPPPYLSDDQIERLADLLDQRAAPFQGFNLEALDGYLSAIVVSPGDIPASEWQPAVWGPKPPRWESPAEAEEVAMLLSGHLNGVTARARQGEDLPDHLSPLLWLPEDPMAEQKDDLDVGRDWAFGFFRGVELRSDDWDTWLDKEDWIDEIFALLEQLGTGEITSDNPQEAATPVTYRERVEIVASLPGMLADLYVHRIEQLTPRTPAKRADGPDRNDLCPCGSGKKYKKCHGQN
ncbi:MAG TPA: UPF0149 family protein [Arenimonas sp.]|uniref:UPF0149 family protein n=1 Tax=Arenimonas sp. TaxID=1872635 RepID=UPI002B8D5CC3|nr:UPF0149 family protein [Arenimonas sp.]HMB57721.1 UPF0149 family protein [Arenimonas sp.]